MITTLSANPGVSPLPATNKVEAASGLQPLQAPLAAVGALASPGRSLPGMAESIAQPLLWEDKSRDALGALISVNYSSTSPAGRFKGLGAALLDQITGDVSQSVRRAPPGSQLNPYGAVVAAPRTGLHGRGDNRVGFEITTVSRVRVQISLDSQDDGLGVRMTVDGKLSETERKALAGLSAAFEDAVAGIVGEPPQIKLAGLMGFDRSVLASVSLHVDVRPKDAPGAVRTLDLHADATQRKVSFNGPDGMIDIGVDMSKFAGVGAKGEQAKAVAAYLKQFDEAALHGRADAAQMARFKAAFAALHGDYGIEVEPLPTRFSAGRPAVGGETQPSLSGLADFSASIKQTEIASNPMRQGETDSFAYQLSQQTDISGHSRSDRSISQQQQSRLTASYHLPSVPGGVLSLNNDPASQNYDYYQIDDAASTTTAVTYKEGKLTKATLDQSASESTRVMRYLLGQLMSDVTTPRHGSRHVDLLASD